MLRKAIKKLIKFSPQLIILVIWLYLVNVNFAPGTFLSGWDNLHPEYNLLLNIKRSFFAVWQEYQGLGLVGGMAHAADLPRQILLGIFSFILPTNTLRYFWTFLMLLIGPLGVYYLLEKQLFSEGKTLLKKVAGLVGGLFYLFNLATVQYFFTPFETFVSFYGFFPWLLFFVLKYLRDGNRKTLVSFFFLSLLATPSFYVQTLFIVYILVLCIFFLESIIQKGKRALPLIAKVVLTVLAVNAFWLLPVFYFSFTKADVVTESKINSIATPETRIMNESSGKLKDIATLKGFWFNYFDFDDGGNLEYLYKDWNSYQEKNPNSLNVAYALFGISLFGLISGIFRRRGVWRFSPIAIFILSFFMLASSNPPFGSIFKLISGKSTLFAEMFRSVFTKWSIVAALSYSFGLATIVFLVGKLRKEAAIFLAFILVLATTFVVQPVFKGKLISKRMEVVVPNEYFEVFKYFKDEPKEKRIALFPVHSFWGWNYYNWGYRGSGFLWYGIEQPILDRAFDVWSKYNETFYNEINRAIYSKDPNSFERTLKKYQVSYLVFDESIMNTLGSEDFLYFDEAKNLIGQIDGIKLEKKYDFISIYNVNLASNGGYFWTPESFVLTDTDTTYFEEDPVYEQEGNYVFDREGITFPLVNLDQREDVKVVIGNERVGIVGGPLNFFGKKIIKLPDATNPDYLVFVNNEKAMEFSYRPLEKYEIDLENSSSKMANCDIEKRGEVFKENKEGKVIYRAENGGVVCDFINFPELSFSQGYILRVVGENFEGRSLKVYLQNWTTKRMDIETLLPEGKFDEVLFILPKNVEGSGYTLNLETRSYGNVASKNLVEKIEIISFPYEYLKQIKLVPEIYSVIQNDAEILAVDKIGSSHYLVKTNNPGLIAFGQGYEKGWQAHVVKSDKYISITRFFPWIFGEKLEHIKVNSWENGWYLPEGKNTVVVTYAPQYLEYTGIIILFCSLIFIIRKNKKGHF